MKSSILALSIGALLTGSQAALAQDMPSAEEMWRIIQKQQRELQELKSQVQDTDQKAEAAVEAAESGDGTGGANWEELERRVGILAEEIEGTRRESLIDPEEAGKQRGIGPSATGVYGVKEGLAFGGYGEMFYKDTDDEGDDEADFLRGILYVGYRFSDKLLFNSEIEFEHADSAFVEFAYLDYLYDDSFNLRGGLLLTPLGFVNEMHEPPYFFGNLRPPVETQIIPSTTRENGAGIYGRLGGDVDYRLYVQNSFDGKGISGSNLRGLRQKGSNALAEDLAVTGSIDWHPMPGLTLGASYWTGGLDQNQDFNGQEVDFDMDLFDVRAEYNYGPLRLRALYTQASLDGDLVAVSTDRNEAIPEEMEGWYAEAGYDILTLFENTPPGHSLYPWVRYSQIDTQASISPAVQAAGFSKDPKNDRNITEVGLHYMPHPQVVLKAEYRSFDSEADASQDGTNNQDEVVFGLGYNF